jgi:hypothetical protein
MSPEHWAIIIAISGVNLSTLIVGIVHLTSRLTRIETDIKWIKAGCPKCQQNNYEKEEQNNG